MQNSNNIPNLKPFVKWVGGKNTSVNRLLELMPDEIGTYVELFVGSGALFFSLNFKKAIINDSNSELINTYKVIKDHVGELKFFLSSLIYDKELFLKIRSWDREPDYLKRAPIDRAGRFIYLMKTCYNGLYRVSQKNYFNTPFGQYTDPNICDSPTLDACSSYLNDRDVSIFNQDYEALLDKIDSDSFVYLDPPYFPISKTANFTSYQKDKFNDNEQYRLFNFCKALHRKGVKFMLSNSDIPEVRDLYKEFNIHVIEVPRRINSKSTKRSAVNELAVTNYDKDTFELLK